MKKRLCVIALSFLVICSLLAMNAMVGEAWILTLGGKGQYNGADTATIGVDPNTGLFPYPPSPPPGFTVVLKLVDPNGTYTGDIRAPGNAQEEWSLTVMMGGTNFGGANDYDDANSPFYPTLDWDANVIATLDPNDTLCLRMGDASGPVIADLMTDLSYQTQEADISNPAANLITVLDYALIEYTIVYTPFIRTWYRDADGDGIGDPNDSIQDVTQPPGYVGGPGSWEDCDDSDPNTFLGAAEVCDGKDTDCDGFIPVIEIDDDGDGFSECEGDCDDTDNTVYPGAPELCDGKDNDCNGPIDDGVTFLTYYRDVDGDGYGDSADSVSDCQQPAGYVLDSTDCHDGDNTVYPGATEICDGKDNNCDTSVPADEADNDLDGVRVCDGDCDDNDAATYPGATEICDGEDNDCDLLVPADEVDADSDGVMVCDGDCDDADAATYPGAAEICDGEDNDCDLSVPADETDADTDGFMICENDCDDTDPAINPNAPELCDGIDNDCNGVIDDPNALTYNDYYRDADGDGYGDPNDSQNDCVQPAGYILDSTDCDDADPNINTAATEVCDGIDNDCNGIVDDPNVLTFEDYYRDADEDGYGDPNDSQNACSQPDGYVLDDTDCDDADAAINPAAEEVYDGIDNNCDGRPDEQCYFINNLIATGQDLSGQTQTVSVEFGVDWDLAGVLVDPNNWADDVVRLQLIDELADPNNLLDSDYLISDIRSPDPNASTTTTWNVLVETGGEADANQPPVLSWDPDSFGCTTEIEGSICVFALMDDTGTVLVADMTDTNSFQTDAQNLTIQWNCELIPEEEEEEVRRPTGNIFPWPGVYPGGLGWGGLPFSAGFRGGLPYPMTSGYAPGLSIPSFPGTYTGFTYPGSVTPWTSFRAWTSYVPRFPVTFPNLGIFSPVGQFGWPMNYWTGYRNPFNYQSGWFYTYR